MPSTRRIIPRRAKRLFRYWRAERRTLGQGVVALGLSTLAGFVAGFVLANITGTLNQLPGLVVLIPAAVGMKGTIFGALGARLGTADAAGLLEISLRRRDGVLYRNARVAILTTLSSSLWLAVLARAATAAFGGPSISVWSLAVISIVGGLVGSIVILGITVALSALSTRRGWDLDSVSTPMVTALGDMTTLPCLYLATFLVHDPAVRAVTAAICVVVALIATVRSYVVKDPVVRRIILEMTATILLTPILDVLAGQLLSSRQSALIAVPVVLALIPPFVSQAGALGGIFSSRLASKLQLGVVDPRGRPSLPALVDASIVVGLSLVVFTLIGAVAWVLGEAGLLAGGTVPSFGLLVASTVASGLLLTPITIVASYYLAIAIFRFGLDPDNQGVPIITSVMDLTGVACILFVMTSFGVIR